MAKIAGILSTAKSKSVNSMTQTTIKSGVAYLSPFWRTKNFPHSKVSVTLGKKYFTTLAPAESEKFLFSSCSCLAKNDLIPA